MRLLHSRSLLFAAIVLLVVGGGLLLLSGSPSVVVAQSQMTIEEKTEIMRHQFGHGGNSSISNTTLLIIAVCVIVGGLGTLFVVDRVYRVYNTKNGYYSPGKLFRELCQSHEFTKYQQTILRDIARELQLKNPVVLFVEPRHLELAITEQVVRHPQESIRHIYSELFGIDARSIGAAKEENDTWFAWTKVITNPEADQLQKEGGPLTPTQQWSPALLKEVQRTAQGQPRKKADFSSSESSQAPIAPLPPEQDQTAQEKTVYKPRYPETQNALVHQTPGDQKTPPPKTPPSPGSQILSSMLYSVSDVTNELAYSSIRNHLTRSLSLSPQSLGEMKQRNHESPPSGQAIPLDEIMISPQNRARQPWQPERQTQTQVETKTEPKVAITQIELKRSETGTTGPGSV